MYLIAVIHCMGSHGNFRRRFALLCLFENINCNCCIQLNIDRFAGCEEVSSMVLHNLNRNNTPTGFKKSGFKRLRLFDGFEFYVVSDYFYHHHCELRFYRELYGCYVRTLTKFLQLLSACGHAIDSVETAIAGLTFALLEPSAHNSEVKLGPGYCGVPFGDSSTVLGFGTSGQD
jgi:hypothetical protein